MSDEFSGGDENPEKEPPAPRTGRRKLPSSKRTKTVQSEVEPTSAGRLTQFVETAAAGPAPMTSGLQPLTRMFMASLIFGVALSLCALSESNRALQFIGVLGPIAATALYPLWGASLKLHRRASLREKFADNCYYLGFIFTQVALVVGFLPVALMGRTIGSADILRFFGLALGASLIGLVARTIFIQTGHTVTENADIVESEVEAVARSVSAKSKEVLQQFEGLSEELSKRYQALGSALDKPVLAIAENLTRYSSAIEGELSKLSGAAAQVTQSSQQAAVAVEAQQESLAKQLRELAGSIDGVRSLLETRVGEATGAIGDTARALSEGMSALQALPKVTGSLDRLASRVDGFEVALSGIGGKVDEAASRIDQASDSAVQAVQGRAEAAANQTLVRAEAVGQEFSAAVTALENTLSAFRSELERVRG